MQIKKNIIAVIIFSVLVLAKQEVKAGLGKIPSSYFFNAHFAVHSPFKDLYYKISTVPDIDIPANKLVYLSDSVASNWPKVKVDNGTKIILRPEISATNYTTAQKEVILGSNPFVIIERKNDIITVYLISKSIGNKLVFNIPAFENVIRDTWKYQHDLAGDVTFGWNFGFEFYTPTCDFVGQSGQRSFFSSMGINIFDTQLIWQSRLHLGPSAVQYIIAAPDMSKWNPNVLFDKNVVYKKPLSNEDVVYVHKILSGAGVKLK